MIKKIENGQIIVTGRNPEGDLELEYADSLGTKNQLLFGIQCPIQPVNMEVALLRMCCQVGNLHTQNRSMLSMTLYDL